MLWFIGNGEALHTGHVFKEWNLWYLITTSGWCWSSVICYSWLDCRRHVNVACRLEQFLNLWGPQQKGHLWCFWIIRNRSGCDAFLKRSQASNVWGVRLLQSSRHFSWVSSVMCLCIRTYLGFASPWWLRCLFFCPILSPLWCWSSWYFSYFSRDFSGRFWLSLSCVVLAR